MLRAFFQSDAAKTASTVDDFLHVKQNLIYKCEVSGHNMYFVSPSLSAV